MIKKCLLLWLVWVAGVLWVQGQQNFSYALLPFTGTFLSHKNQRLVKEQPQWGWALEMSKETHGKRYWQFAHGFPQMGLRLEMRNLGQTKVYGTAYSAIPFLEFNIIRNPKNSLRIRHGTGLAYVTRRYQEITQPNNELIGSHLNAASFIGLGYQLTLSKQLDLKLGGLLLHLSNGGIQLPNAGVNTLSVYGGLAWFPHRKVWMNTSHDRVRPVPRWHWRLGLALGWYDKGQYSQKPDLNNQASIMVFRQHNSRFRTGMGLEAGFLGHKRQSWQPAVYLEEEVQFKNITTRYGLGVYLAQKGQVPESFYSKIGLAYFPLLRKPIPEGWFMGAALKAHGFRAAHVELSTGFVF